jgi:hypothetical protein
METLRSATLTPIVNNVNLRPVHSGDEFFQTP